MKRTREAQVSFFEVQDELGKTFDDLIDWQGFLAEIAQEPREKRKYPIHDVMTWGEVFHHRGANHFILARRRDSVSSFDTDTGEIIDYESAANRPWVDFSVAVFLPNTNRLGFVLGSNSSPHVSSLEEWLNAHRLFDKKLLIAPVLDRDTVSKIKGAASASLVRVTFSPGQAETLQGAHGLFDFGRKLQQTYGDVTASLELKIERNARRPEEQRGLLQEVRNLVGGAAAFEKAAANIIQVDDSGRERKRLIDLVKHKVTKKTKVELLDKEGRSVRIPSVIDAIFKAADQLKEDLYVDPR